tara:strand:- start:1655 stop:3538 length:1884 start_codon:yes stop_codon:yes gene_type:complete
MADSRNAKISVTDVDFDSLKSSLKDYLKDQETFKDYNFEGAGLNILLDILAYNSHYQAFYANMVANEMFLDTAIKRSSIVSLAKHLGYTPNSIRASKATIKAVTTGTSNFTIPKGTVIQGTVGNDSFNFVTLDDYASSVTAGITGAQFDIYEGTLRTKSYKVDNSIKNQKFILPENTDTTTLKIRVQNSETDTTGYSTLWTLANDMNVVSDTDKVYHIQETDEGTFEIYFGDNIVGLKPSDGNLIIAQFVVTNGESANGVGRNEAANNPSFSLSGYNITTVSSAAGGAEPESTKSIKFHAPKNYQAQDRSVTDKDFATLLLKDYPSLESVFVWGGQDNDPPAYGKVFIAAKPKVGLVVDDSEKENIKNTISRNRSIVSIIPEIVDPDTIYIKMNLSVVFDKNKTALDKGGITELVKSTVKTYIDNDLEKFDRDLYFSKLTTLIGNIGDSIVGTESQTKIQKRFSPSLNVTANYEILFGNELIHPHDGHMTTIRSTGFSYKDEENAVYENCSLEDDGSGKMQIVRYDKNNVRHILYANAGTVDYLNGKINLNEFRPLKLVSGDAIRVDATPKSSNIYATRNQILTLDTTDLDALVVNVETTLEAESSKTKNATSSGKVNGGGAISTGY